MWICKWFYFLMTFISGRWGQYMEYYILYRLVRVTDSFNKIFEFDSYLISIRFDFKSVQSSQIQNSYNDRDSKTKPHTQYQMQSNSLLLEEQFKRTISSKQLFIVQSIRLTKHRSTLLPATQPAASTHLIQSPISFDTRSFRYLDPTYINIIHAAFMKVQICIAG